MDVEPREVRRACRRAGLDPERGAGGSEGGVPATEEVRSRGRWARWALRALGGRSTGRGLEVRRCLRQRLSGRPCRKGSWLGSGLWTSDAQGWPLSARRRMKRAVRVSGKRPPTSTSIRGSLCELTQTPSIQPNEWEPMHWCVACSASAGRSLGSGNNSSERARTTRTLL